ncbi:NuA4-domain-containing protein [Mytilinidion resinicola]|uniref:Chromatin modification-related protein EAF6 n=1 Tax=Mytilinidion resinicola TaxID=574789 RepID=A0A6A6YI61_9PEZI|nr:NuA4-domain-containing protein [Mytilinidion resinicola]KAF2808532.1 NuA4-domain-containing protein [Mytilinidion resinicola]
MAENAPPPGSGGQRHDASAGMPYYEKLRRDLRETLQKKRQLDNSLATLEESIYKAETSYLEETSAGNIIKGFDNYIKGSTGITTAGGAGPGTSTRRKAMITEADRIFSRSSASFMRDSPTPNSAQTTPSHAPTPTSSFPSGRESSHPTPNGSTSSKAVASKKKKAPEKDDDETDGKPPLKRGKITYGRD